MNLSTALTVERNGAQSIEQHTELLNKKDGLMSYAICIGISLIGLLNNAKKKRVNIPIDLIFILIQDLHIKLLKQTDG